MRAASPPIKYSFVPDEDASLGLVEEAAVWSLQGNASDHKGRRCRILWCGCLLALIAVSALVIIRHSASLEDSMWQPVLFYTQPATALGIVAAKLAGASKQSNQWEKHVKERAAWGHEMSVNGFHGTVFYPFSGADALTAVSIFPNARSIVLAAMHNVGNCQALNWPDLGNRSAAIATLLKGNFAGNGYFGTEEMYEHFDDTGLGVTSFLLASLYLMGREPISIDCGADVGPQGHNLGLASGDAVRIVHRPRRMSYFSPQGQTQELIYARVDLLTRSLMLDGVLRVIGAQAPITTLMKATGYILRRASDNSVNRRPGYKLDSAALLGMILTASGTILQDDTGVRISCLTTWTKVIFGTYIGPAYLANMTVESQYDYDDGLRSIFCSGTAESHPLPVHFGYPIFFNVNTCPAQPSLLNGCGGPSADPGPVSVFNMKKSKGFAVLATRRNLRPVRW